MPKTLKELLDTLPQEGEVVWMGVRPARKEPMKIVKSIAVSPEIGLEGDRYSGRTGTRHITLIQAEHLVVVESVLGTGPITPESLRRNVVVRGINLLALKNRDISIGSDMLRVTGLCRPCSHAAGTTLTISASAAGSPQIAPRLAKS